MKRHTFIVPLGGAACALGIALPLAVSSVAMAQEYPSRPINVIVSFPPGGNTDIMARALQNEMSKALGQTIVIINKPGCGRHARPRGAEPEWAGRLHDCAHP